jgi:Phr family secreted Rap phosphatase inhibitor
MKKVGIIFLCVGIFAILACGCNTTEKKNNKSNEKSMEWQSSYTTFLKELNKNKSNYKFEFLIKDLDNDNIPELIVKEELKLTVYRYDTEIVQIGNYDFTTGTTRFFSSDNSNYLGIFYFYVSGGLNHYGYINVQKEKLVIEELWNEDYSGISKEIGEKREKIKELSNDKKLIEESKKVYKANSDIEFIQINSNNLDKLEKIVEEYVTK